MTARQDLESIFRAAVAACHPTRVVPAYLPEPPEGRTILLAIGKAAGGMARAVEAAWDGPLSGLAVVPHGAAEPLERIECVGAGHPVPDEASLIAAERLLALARQAGADDLVLVLLSGGASALACLPGKGLSLEDKQALTTALLRSGAPIEEINAVRRHLSRIKGGRLARAAQPARLVTLAISDVVGNRPEDIGSGPTVADPTSLEDAQAILARHGIDAPDRGWSETVKPSESKGWHADYRIIASSDTALGAAAREAARLGWEAVSIDAHAQGEARDTARRHASMALETLRSGRRIALISGGELTVTRSGQGSGGPSREYALALALALDGTPGITALAADTDGLDGSHDAAGAFIDSTTLARAKARKLDASAALRSNDSGAFFATLGDAFVTGPTGTNVNDLRTILIDPTGSRE